MNKRVVGVLLSLVALGFVFAAYAAGQSYSYTVTDRDTQVVRFSVTGGMNVHEVLVSVNVTTPATTPGFSLSLSGAGTEDFADLALTLDANALNTDPSASLGKYISLYTGTGDNSATDSKYLLDIAKKPISGTRGKVTVTESWVLTITGLTTPNVLHVTIGERKWNDSFGAVPAQPHAGAIYPSAITLLSNAGAALDAPPVISITPAGPSVADGGSVALTTGLADDTSTPPYSYHWSVPGASSLTGETTATATPLFLARKGSYPATVTVTDGNGQYGRATATVTVTNDFPSAVSISVTPASTTPFTGASRRFTALASDEQPGSLSYSWAVTGGTITSTPVDAPSIEVSFGTPGSGTASLSVTDDVAQTTSASALSLGILPKENLVIPGFALLPANYAPPVIDGLVSEDLGTAVPDVSWSGATRIDYGDGTTRDLAIQALNCPDPAGKRCLYYSFEVRNDPSFDTGDFVLLAFRGPGAGTAPDTSAAFLEGDTAILVYALPSGGMTPGSSLVPNLVQFWRYQSGAWALVATGAASLTGFDAKSRILPASTPQAWDLEVKVPMDDESAADSVAWPDLKNSFLFYCDVGRLNGSTLQLVQLHWPREAPDLAGTLSPALLAASDWSGATTDPGAQGRGVYIHSALDLGVLDSTGTVLGNEISTIHDNGFRATVSNSSLTTLPGATTVSGAAAPKVSATFRIAAWGTSYDSPQWSVIPANAASVNPTAAHDIDAPTDSALDGSFASPGTYRFGFEAPALPVLNGMRHQCLFVELKSLGNVRILNNRVYRNMEYVDASKFEDQARIDPGYPRPLPEGRDFERFFLQIGAQSFERDLRPAPQSLSQVSTLRPVSTLVWIAHSLRDTGRRLVVRGRSYLIVQRSGSFGYVVRHTGDASRWIFDVKGARKIGANLYQYDIPLARMRANVAEIVYPRIEPVDRLWRIALRGGSVLPLSPIASNYGPGIAAALDAGVLVAPELRLGLLLGYEGLVGRGGTADRPFANVSLQAAYIYGLNGPWNLEALGGLGWYQVPGGYGDWGLHAGLAAERSLSRPVALRVEADFHRVLDMARSQFLTAGLALAWKF